MPPKPELTADQRKQIVSHLLLEVKIGSDPPKLRLGELSSVAIKFEVSTNMISRIWKRARESYADPGIGAFRASPWKNKSGRHQKYDRQAVREAIKEVPAHQRKNLRQLSFAIGIPLSTLHYMKKEDNCVILPHSNPIKRTLRDHHKLARVMYAIENLDLGTEQFNGYFNHVHVDEKFLFFTEAQLFMYLVPGEKPPNHNTRHKSHILKVMFLAAVARPRYNDAGECTFDGKVGMWPFVKKVAAQRTSCNRPAGTMETKPVSVTEVVYRDFMVNKVLPTIKRVWPDRDHDIIIQQDGAEANIAPNDPVFQVATAGNWNTHKTISLIVSFPGDQIMLLLLCASGRPNNHTNWNPPIFHGAAFCRCSTCRFAVYSAMGMVSVSLL